ncbi:MAG TPA: hypothetical protein VJS39_10285 [Gemmatimonadaceae bacterium]|nr:hypothetical protein [Gemmatimonadaceae bacterium]
MKQATLAIGVLLSATMIVGCGSDKGPTNPGGGGGATLAGNYTATQWVTTGGSGQTNQIVAGSTLTITLNSNGSTTGHMHLVASAGNPAVDADMAGTWTLIGSTVQFTQSADTFVKDMQFGVVANGAKWALEGDQVFSGTRVQLTLTQS